jgi:crotonobetainyl-CoA:carnitine CoA-transferase CaiB-like acyl-CoA transferase
LAGIKVVDFSTLLPGPLASLMLSEAGAEVLKIEPPGGEGQRRLGFGAGFDDAIFALLNAGKQSICADLKDVEERDRVLALVEGADILLEQFRPGVMQRLGLDYGSVRALNPKIIYCSITGYGQEGPRSQQAGHDLNYMAETGILGLSPGQGARPSVPPVLAADIAGGTYPAFFNILLALMQRDRSGKGQHLDISMADGLFPFAFWALAMGWGGQTWPKSGSSLLNGGSPRYHLYRAADDKLVAVAAIEDKFWQALCEAVALEPEYASTDAAPDAVISALEEIFAKKDSSHWRRVLDEADCCCCIVEELEDAVQDPHFIVRGLFARQVQTTAGAVIPALPIPIANSLRSPSNANVGIAPEVGGHNHLIESNKAELE